MDVSVSILGDLRILCEKQGETLRIHATEPCFGCTAEQQSSGSRNYMMQSVQRGVRFPIAGDLI